MKGITHPLADGRKRGVGGDVGDDVELESLPPHEGLDIVVLHELVRDVKPCLLDELTDGTSRVCLVLPMSRMEGQWRRDSEVFPGVAQKRRKKKKEEEEKKEKEKKEEEEEKKKKEEEEEKKKEETKKKKEEEEEEKKKEKKKKKKEEEEEKKKEEKKEEKKKKN